MGGREHESMVAPPVPLAASPGVPELPSTLLKTKFEKTTATIIRKVKSSTTRFTTKHVQSHNSRNTQYGVVFRLGSGAALPRKLLRRLYHCSAALICSYLLYLTLLEVEGNGTLPSCGRQHDKPLHATDMKEGEDGVLFVQRVYTTTTPAQADPTLHNSTLLDTLLKTQASDNY